MKKELSFEKFLLISFLIHLTVFSCFCWKFSEFSGRTIWLNFQKAEIKNNSASAIANGFWAERQKKITSQSERAGRALAESAGSKSENSGLISGYLPAQLLSTPLLFYPSKAVAAGQKGRVLLEVMLSASGEVLGAEIKESSGFAVLDEAAQAQSLKWRYTPAFYKGIPIASKLLVPVKFIL